MKAQRCFYFLCVCKKLVCKNLIKVKIETLFL